MPAVVAVAAVVGGRVLIPQSPSQMSPSLGGRWVEPPHPPPPLLPRHGGSGSSSNLLGITFNSHAFAGVAGWEAAICHGEGEEREGNERAGDGVLVCIVGWHHEWPRSPEVTPPNTGGAVCGVGVRLLCGKRKLWCNKFYKGITTQYITMNNVSAYLIECPLEQWCPHIFTRVDTPAGCACEIRFLLLKLECYYSYMECGWLGIINKSDLMVTVMMLLFFFFWVVEGQMFTSNTSN